MQMTAAKMWLLKLTEKEGESILSSQASGHLASVPSGECRAAEEGLGWRRCPLEAGRTQAIIHQGRSCCLSCPWTAHCLNFHAGYTGFCF